MLRDCPGAPSGVIEIYERKTAEELADFVRTLQNQATRYTFFICGSLLTTLRYRIQLANTSWHVESFARHSLFNGRRPVNPDVYVL